MALKSVLIVEDNADVRFLYEQALAREGFKVTACCSTGRQALEAMKSPIPAQLVILDLSLPDLPGIELVHQLRAHPTWRRSKIVVVSGWEREDDGLKVDGYLRKPFELKTFCQTVRNCVSEGRA